ncbi:hypothetical protein EYF80_052249 [Liparis tanakae]|uniref:Uncharacterized protein n=1 Tax=Liparis tanakae TaxID=230148 RepID=A0A4Z2F9L9_9TELE|nr:hypothetical protein EYF80_052249 [Liparis tanakae]
MNLFQDFELELSISFVDSFIFHDALESAQFLLGLLRSSSSSSQFRDAILKQLFAPGGRRRGDVPAGGGQPGLPAWRSDHVPVSGERGGDGGPRRDVTEREKTSVLFLQELDTNMTTTFYQINKLNCSMSSAYPHRAHGSWFLTIRFYNSGVLGRQGE